MKFYVNNRIEFITTECFTKSFQVQKQVNSGLNFEDVKVHLKLSVFLKPFHVTLLVEMYKFLSFNLSQGLQCYITMLGKKSCPGDRVSLKREIKVT